MENEAKRICETVMLAQETFPEVGDESHFYHGGYQVSSSKVLYGRLKGKE